MQPSTARTTVLAAIVAAQTLLIGLDGSRTIQALDRAGWLFSMTEGYMGWLRMGVAAVLVWVAGLLPLLLALALGATAAWGLRRFSATPDHIDGLGRPIVVLVLVQCAVLGVWFRLLPDAVPGDGWHNDGLPYTVMSVLTGMLWAFCNPLLLWRAAGGQPPRRDAHELQQLHEIGLRHARAITIAHETDDEHEP